MRIWLEANEYRLPRGAQHGGPGPKVDLGNGEWRETTINTGMMGWPLQLVEAQDCTCDSCGGIFATRMLDATTCMPCLSAKLAERYAKRGREDPVIAFRGKPSDV